MATTMEMVGAVTSFFNGMLIDSWSPRILLAFMYNDFDIILGPVPTYHGLFAALHAPGDVPCMITMVTGC